MVTAPYEVDGHIVGSVGVIGPCHGLRARDPDREHHSETALLGADLSGRLLIPQAPEPDRPASESRKTAVLLINLGTPDAATTSAVRHYLGEFLSDPRVVEFPRALVADSSWDRSQFSLKRNRLRSTHASGHRKARH